jgi:hypothetical protein
MHSDDDSFQEFLNVLGEKHKGQLPPEEVQAALLHSFETARQEPNDSSTVYGIEDTDLKDGKDADLEDDRHAKTKSVDGTKTAHDGDAGPCSASNDDNDDGEAAA